MKGLVKKILYNNPLKRRREDIFRRTIKNTDASFLVPNCIGGILFHDMGLRFLSPTVNLMMTQTDFFEFVMDLDDYLDGEFVFHDNTTECPCADLYPLNGNKCITVNFTHYKSKKEAIEKWNSRKKRINKNNLFIFLEERDGLTEENINELAKLDVKGIVVFTCNEYKDIPYTVYLPKYHNNGEVGNILKQNHFTGKREYENYFDFVRWFNEADGYPYNVQEFIINNCQTR